MDLTPRTLRDVEFRERRFGGYDPDDVDGFLERAAAGLEVLLRHLSQTEERAIRAEQHLMEAEEGVRRTLVLAQRTADAALLEAEQRADALRSEAERLHAEAKAEHERLLEVARFDAQTAAEQAQEEARVVAQQAQQRLHDDIARLDGQRARLVEDISSLDRLLEAERARLRGVLIDQLQRLDEGLPPPSPDPGPQPDAELAAERAQPEEGRLVEPPADDEPSALFDQEAPPPEAEAEFELEPEPEPAPEAPQPSEMSGLRPEIAGREDGSGNEVDPDPYFAALREAVDDTSPLGPRDDEGLFPAAEVEDASVESGTRGLFRRRL